MENPPEAGGFSPPGAGEALPDIIKSRKGKRIYLLEAHDHSHDHDHDHDHGPEVTGILQVTTTTMCSTLALSHGNIL